MSWRRAGVYWTCFALLGVYYLAFLRPPADKAAAHRKRAAFINVADTDVQSLEMRRGTAVVRCQRVEGRWQVVEPAGGRVPSDLVAGLVANLSQLPDVEVVADGSTDLAQFGLDPPVSQLVLSPSNGAPIQVRLGSRNPAGTAVYAQRNESPRIFLIGLNVRYYEDLVFQALGLPG